VGGGGAHVGTAHVGGGGFNGGGVRFAGAGAHYVAATRGIYNYNHYPFYGARPFYHNYLFRSYPFGWWYPFGFGGAGLFYGAYYDTYLPLYYPAPAMPSYSLPPDYGYGALPYGMQPPGGQQFPQTPQPPGNQAQVQVILPDPEASVLFDIAKTTSVGKVRLFDTPELKPDTKYMYKVTATWVEGGKAVTDVRNVPVMAGRASVADFTRPAPPEPLPPPTPAKDQD
jgi:uncharacterized protein (TIGR03000 family)